MTPRILFLALLVLLAGCEGPFLLLPGGRMSGENQSPGPNWSFAGEYGTVQLETNPEDPYSVNVAYTVIAGALYINAGDTETQWVKNMTENPVVRLRIDGAIYPASAERVTERSEIEAFASAWTSQSFFRRDPSDLAEVWLYRMVSL